MRVAGASFVRNAIQYGYPVEAAIRSVLPLCNKFFITVGDSEDATEALIQSIAPDKIQIIPSVWSPQRHKGQVLAEETNKTLDCIPDAYDWIFYLQADEVLHEMYRPIILKAMQTYLHQPQVEGLLFKYLHFYGSYDYIGDSRIWYRQEIRVIRNDKAIRSYRDAQGFRKNNKKLKVKAIDAYIYHYGWVKPPRQQAHKRLHFDALYNPDSDTKTAVITEDFSYETHIDSLKPFTGTHPQTMQTLIKRQNWHFQPDLQRKNFRSLHYKFLYYFEKYTKKRLFEYKNFKKI